jgi:hypothetical protein
VVLILFLYTFSGVYAFTGVFHVERDVNKKKTMELWRFRCLDCTYFPIFFVFSSRCPMLYFAFGLRIFMKLRMGTRDNPNVICCVCYWPVFIFIFCLVFPHFIDAMKNLYRYRYRYRRVPIESPCSFSLTKPPPISTLFVRKFVWYPECCECSFLFGVWHVNVRDAGIGVVFFLNEHHDLIGTRRYRYRYRPWYLFARCSLYMDGTGFGILSFSFYCYFLFTSRSICSTPLRRKHMSSFFLEVWIREPHVLL